MPRLPLLFARRYLFSKKSHSVINIVSGVSAFAVSIPVAAMVVLLSVFNGFESLVRGMSNHFDPDIVITPAQGKVFKIGSLPDLQAVDEVEAVSFLLEENALFAYRDRQALGMIRGVDSLYGRVIPLDSLVIQGQYRLRLGDFREALVGQGMAYTLGIRTTFNDPLRIYVPRRGTISPLLPQSIYRHGEAFPSGIFMLDAESDGRYVFVELALVQELLDYPGMASQAAVRLRPGASPETVQKALSEALGGEYRVLTRYQQNESFYRIMLYEKWGIYCIILLVLLVASCSLVGSLAMLIIEKRKDSRTLVTLGADVRLLRRIFIGEGMLIYGIGAATGLLFGIALSLLQQHFGLIAMGGQTFLVDAYPVRLRALDLLWIAATAGILSWGISTLTVRAMIRPRIIRPGDGEEVL